MYRLKFTIICLLAVSMLGQSAYAATQVSQFGITWTFDHDYQVGQFANGDYWVVGPVTITSVTPGWDGAKNGSMVNPVPAEGVQGYSSLNQRLHFDDNVRAKFPLHLDPSGGIKSLISTIGLHTSEVNWDITSRECLRTAAILTVLDSPVPAGTFRPPYVNGSKPLHNIDGIQWDKLPLLPDPSASVSLPDFSASTFMKRPWIDHGPHGDGMVLHPIENLRPYHVAGTILPTDVADMSLLVMLDIPQRQELVIRFIQLGIDTYAIALQNSEDGWAAHGGGNNGRKWPILFAGIMLNDGGMQNPPDTVTGSTYVGRLGPNRYFGEDGHTYYGQPTADYPNGKPLWGEDCLEEGRCGDGRKDCRDPDGLLDGCSYIGNTSLGWPGQALAAHIMADHLDLEVADLWNWPAFSSYVDRWAYEGSPDYPGSTFWTWGSSFVKYMWNAYRGPAYPDGECNGDEPLNCENYPLDCECNAPATTTSSLTQHGITWTFDTEYEYGQFANGDYWVVPNTPGGTVTIVSISPTPTGGRNGFEINPMPGQEQPYDSRIYFGSDLYNAALQPVLPVAVQPGSSVVSAISNPEGTDCQNDVGDAGWWVYTGPGSWCSLSRIKTAAVLTVLGSAPPGGSFRPPYIGNNKPLYSSLNLHTELLPNLAPVGNEPTLSELERRFERVWLDHIFGYESRGYHPTDNMVNDYGAGIAVDTGEGALRLLLNDSLTDKQTLLIRYVQLGIDLYWMTQYGHSWRANGGHGSGRKIPILFAGLMLDDAGMKGIGTYPLPYNGFGEDCQTYYDASEFPRWGIRHCWQPELDDENNGYRSCCTSQSWVGAALVARILGIEDLWNHQAFLDYVDRWMTESNNGDWGSAWADLMWETYRETGPPQDTEGPSFTTGNVTKNSVEVVFNEPVDEASAENLNNYSISPGISISSAVLDSLSNTVTLLTSDHTEDVTYTITVSNVEDTAGNPMPTPTVTFYIYTYGNGLVGHWEFKDGNDPVVDSSGKGNTATLVNGAQWTNEGEISFDGVNDALEVPTAGWKTNQGTIALWAKAYAFSEYAQYFFGHNVGFWTNTIQLYTNGVGGNLYLGLGGSHFLATDIDFLDVNIWYHLTLTWDSGNYAVYVNGIEKARGTYPALSTLSSFADIGNDGNISERSEAFNGIIDEVRVYDRALTADELSDIALVFLPIGDKTVDEGSTLTFEVRTRDPNVTIDIGDHNLPRDPSFFYNGGAWSFSWTSDYNDAGSYDVNFVSSDNFEIITITVNDLNDVNPNSSPVADAGSDQTVTDMDGNGTEQVTLDGSGSTDSDGTIASYVWAEGASQIATGVSPTVTLAVGVHAITLTVTDYGGLSSNPDTVTITVKKANGPPTLEAIPDKWVSENSLLSFSISATDPDGDPITYSAQNLPNGATFSGNTFSWTPTSGQARTYQVTFIATDGQDQDSQTITITVISTSLTDGLVGYWKLNDNAANRAVVDSSGYGNDGTAQRNTSTMHVAGKINGALNFNGTGDYIDCGTNSSLDITGSVSISAWVKFDTLSVNHQTILAKRGAATDKSANYAVRTGALDDRNQIDFYYHDGANWHVYTTSNANLIAGQWCHIVATFTFGTASSIKCYVNDNVLTGGWKHGNGNSAVKTNTRPVTISGLTTAEKADGIIDNVMIFNRILSQAEINALFNGGAGIEIF